MNRTEQTVDFLPAFIGDLQRDLQELRSRQRLATMLTYETATANAIDLSATLTEGDWRVSVRWTGDGTQDFPIVEDYPDLLIKDGTAWVPLFGDGRRAFVSGGSAAFDPARNNASLTDPLVTEFRYFIYVTGTVELRYKARVRASTRGSLDTFQAVAI